MSLGGSDFDVSDGSGSDFAPPPAPAPASHKKKPPAAARAKPAPPKTSRQPSTKQPLAPRRNNDSDQSASAADREAANMDVDVSPAPTKRPVAAAGKSSKTATETYQKLTQLEHVLLRPDTYIGSIEFQTDELWVFDKLSNQMVFRKTGYVPGFYKIFDEILVNAADNKVRDPDMSFIKVNIDKQAGTISVENNGRGIPIEMHEKEKMWIPQLIFGNLLTSSNYDDGEDKVTGGRNGYGAKLANIYSTEFIVETGNKEKDKKYKQVFTNNMSYAGKPSITKGKQDFTRITFKPDFARFRMEGIEDDIEALMMKRVYDMAGTVKNVNVWLNGERIKINNFKQYTEMYVKAVRSMNDTASDPDGLGVNGIEAKPTIIYEAVEDKGKMWEVAFAVSDGTFRQVSFVNNIATIKGGRHVDYVEHQIVNKIVEFLSKKKETVKPTQVRNYCFLFVNCQIVNPTFDGQTKETLTLKSTNFGSKWQMSEAFEKKVLKSDVISEVKNFAHFQQNKAMKRTDGAKRRRITGIAKLEDANNAGAGAKSKDCTLILTEGDSAKALAVSGLSEVGRDNYGVFPLRGKLLNVREAAHDQVFKNQEINNIKEILGLRHGHNYVDVNSLRYGSLMIMTDQDHDGSHIKGLILNFFDTFYPSLLKIPNFLVEFITPIVKATKGRQEVAFFTMPEYEQWKEENNNGAGWRVKYYKGLGTSESSDMKKYFRAMNTHMLPFEPTTADDRQLIDLAFNKKKADDRKEWLRQFKPGTFLDHNIDTVPVSDFINKELILFSMADNMRSIPSVVDGLKPGQRKIMFGAFKRKLTPKVEVKVAQFGAYVGEHTAYHHGETSLFQTIVGLAQQFVGSNNLNLLMPRGQFGTRAMGGKDAAAPRYIYTSMPETTRLLFHSDDDPLLTYLNEEGQNIEPEWFMPTLPTVLINGSDGIGTGWSTNVPNFNPLDIIANLRSRLEGGDFKSMAPWYRGFTGPIDQVGQDKFKVSGVVSQVQEDDWKEWEITELPIQTWTSNYKEFLEGLVSSEKAPPMIKDYKEYHTDKTVHFVVYLTPKGEEEIRSKGPETFFKLTTTKSTSNMVLFDPEGKIKKYASTSDILEDFYLLRLSYYQKRKDYLVEALKEAYARLQNQARFVKMIIDKELNVMQRKRAAVVADLRAKGFRPFPKAAQAKTVADDDADSDAEGEGSDSDYDYLLTMAIYSLTAEKVAKLLAQRDAKEEELNILLGYTPRDLWLQDLDRVQTEWESLLENDVKELAKDRRGMKKSGKVPIKARAGAAARRRTSGQPLGLEDSEDEFKPKVAPKRKAPVKPKVEPKAEPSSLGVSKPPTASTLGSRQASGTGSGSVSTASARKTSVKRSASTALDDDDLDTLVSNKKPALGTATAASKGQAKQTTLPVTKAKSRTVKLSDSEQEDEPVTEPSKPRGRPAAKKPAASAAAPAKGRKVSTKIESDDDVEMDDSVGDVLPPPPRARSTRARGATSKAKYVISSDEELGDEDDDF